MAYLFEDDKSWDFETIDRTYKAIEDIALNDLGLNVYPNQIEIITSEQMLDSYSSIGMPVMYNHWSFGKHFSRDENLYRKGMQGLAYEIVINSNPCISYCMEGNSMTMQALVIAHAAFGHNHFFKNNYLFQQWTDAEGIHDYMIFAKDYIKKCEEHYGFDQVEEILDSAHALMSHGVDRYRRPAKLSLQAEKDRLKEISDYEDRTYNDLWNTVPKKSASNTSLYRDRINSQHDETQGLRGRAKLPEENILYFLEKNSPVLKPWQKEILRIVRKIAQYFYPQKQTKVMNEGFATFCHYYIMNEMWERGQISDGSKLEFIMNHTNVIAQPPYDSKYYSGFNPYALGFAMMQDIKRICENPTAEDKQWFDWAGGDWRKVLLEAAQDYRDDGFIHQFLSPKVMRDLRLFMIKDEEDEDEYVVTGIHNDRGYKNIRRALAKEYEIGRHEPDIQIIEANLSGDRTLVLEHRITDKIMLDYKSIKSILPHICHLWGYDVQIDSKSNGHNGTVTEHSYHSRDDEDDD